MLPKKFSLILIFSIILTLGLSISLGSILAAWTAPASAPPEGNIAAPINTGTFGQAKQSGLILNTGTDANGLIVQFGNVGIGTTNPGYKLDVSGNINASNICIAGDCKSSWPVGGGGTVTSVTATVPVVSSGGTAPVISMAPATAAANGYMTSAYASKLDGIAAGATVGITQATADASYVNVTGDTMTGDLIINSQQLNHNADNPFYINSYDSLQLRINANGGASEFGVNNSANTRVFTVTNAGDVSWLGTLQGGTVPWTRLTSFPAACSSGQYVTTVGSSLICATPPGGVSGSGTANYITKWTGGTSLGNSQIYDNGTNVGIGESNPQYPLQVTGTSYLNGIVWIKRGSDYGIINDSNGANKIYFSVAGNIIIPTGNVGIGTTNPGAKLDVAGNVKIADGTQSAGKVLTSDASGLASWQPPSSPSSWTCTQVIQSSVNIPWDGTRVAMAAYCPAGNKAITGGCNFLGSVCPNSYFGTTNTAMSGYTCGCWGSNSPPAWAVAICCL